MLHHVYLALKKRLLSELSPAPAYVDWYYGQYLDDENEAPLWDTPAIFIEFLPIQWTNLNGGLQQARLSFNVHLVNTCLSEGAERITDTAALDHLGMAGSVFRSLHQFRCQQSYVPGFEALVGTPDDVLLLDGISRERSEPDHSLSRLLVSVQGFACRITDYSAQRTWTDATATLQGDVVFMPA